MGLRGVVYLGLKRTLLRFLFFHTSALSYTSLVKCNNTYRSAERDWWCYDLLVEKTWRLNLKPVLPLKPTWQFRGTYIAKRLHYRVSISHEGLREDDSHHLDPQTLRREAPFGTLLSSEAIGGKGGAFLRLWFPGCLHFWGHTGYMEIMKISRAGG